MSKVTCILLHPSPMPVSGKSLLVAFAFCSFMRTQTVSSLALAAHTPAAPTDTHRIVWLPSGETCAHGEEPGEEAATN